MNRPDLMPLVGQRVTVTPPGPIHANPETGKLVALADQPTLILDLDNGRRMVFLQHRCEVTKCDEPPVEPPAQPWEDIFDQQATAAHENTLIGRLEGMLTNLQQHIDERAAEIAQPAIDQARAEVAEAQEERDRWQTRFTDLQREMSRQNDALHKRATRAETAITRAKSTLFLNTTAHVSGIRTVDEPLTDYQRGYQACADHVTAALKEADRG